MTANNYIRLDQAKVIDRAMMAAQQHGHPLNTFITIHLKQCQLDSKDRTAFFKYFGDWVRSSTDFPPYYVWVLENPNSSGTHLHAALHDPAWDLSLLKKLARGWLARRTKGALPNKALHVCEIDYARDPSGPGYLGTSGFPGENWGIRGLTGYFLKGGDQAVGRWKGIVLKPQGPINSKRFGCSQTLRKANAKITLRLAGCKKREPNYTKRAFVERVYGMRRVLQQWAQ